MSESKKIGFYTAGGPFDGSSLNRGGGLGGSETAFIQITRALARRGHRVMAFNSCENPGLHDGVEYHCFSAALPVLAREYFDVFVVSRYSAFFNLPISAGLKVLWNHDTLDNPRELRLIHDEIDLFLVLSQFHKDNFLVRLPQIDDRLVVTRNGLDFDLLDRSASQERDPHKLIYASRPERGLKTLLDSIWPRLKRWNPNLTLHVCGYNLELDSPPPQLAEIYRQVEVLLSSTEGVVVLGGLSKSDYYRHLSQSALMLYPCIFPEISCLAALEAQALGVPVLTSDAYALAETVVDPQTRVGGKPGGPDYIHDYVERAMTLLADRRSLEDLGRRSRARIRDRYSWDQIAAEWDRLFSLSLRAKHGQPYLVESSAPAARVH